MLDGDNRLQQQAVGILGVNLIHAVFRYQNNHEELLLALMDNLRGRVHIDMIRLNGPSFTHIDNRLLSLKLVEFEMTDVAMFGPDGKNLHASELLYKKFALVVRGSFRPLTLVNQDMIRSSFDQYRSETDVDASKVVVLTEITLDNLRAHGDIEEKDFLDRVELLCAMGQTVMITNCQQHQKLIHYLEDYKVKQLAMVVGVKVLLDMVNEKYYKHMDASLLSAFGALFANHVKFYVYPAFQEGSAELMTASNLPIPEGIKFLYKHLIDSKQIIDIADPHPEILHIYSQAVLEMIQSNEKGWESYVPSKIAALIKEDCLFGFPCQQLEFEY
jgi:Tat protein secretion system quality control protein TatD with DNase activity